MITCLNPPYSTFFTISIVELLSVLFSALHGHSNWIDWMCVDGFFCVDILKFHSRICHCMNCVSLEFNGKRERTHKYTHRDRDRDREKYSAHIFFIQFVPVLWFDMLSFCASCHIRSVQVIYMFYSMKCSSSISYYNWNVVVQTWTEWDDFIVLNECFRA